MRKYRRIVEKGKKRVKDSRKKTLPADPREIITSAYGKTLSA